MKNMKKIMIGLISVIVVATVFTPSGTLQAAETDETSLKTACLKATIQAVGMEIKGYEMRITAAQNGPGDPVNIPGFEKRIKELQADLEKYRTMNPKDYQLPAKLTVSITVKQAYREGALLDNDNLTRSGPFYHLAGIKNDDYSILVAGHKYTVTIYLVYKRDYPYPDHYVYVLP